MSKWISTKDRVPDGTGSVIYWMPLPAMPKEDDDERL